MYYCVIIILCVYISLYSFYPNASVRVCTYVLVLSDVRAYVLLASKQNNNNRPFLLIIRRSLSCFSGHGHGHHLIDHRWRQCARSEGKVGLNHGATEQVLSVHVGWWWGCTVWLQGPVLPSLSAHSFIHRRQLTGRILTTGVQAALAALRACCCSIWIGLAIPLGSVVCTQTVRQSESEHDLTERNACRSTVYRVFCSFAPSCLPS